MTESENKNENGGGLGASVTSFWLLLDALNK